MNRRTHLLLFLVLVCYSQPASSEGLPQWPRGILFAARPTVDHAYGRPFHKKKKKLQPPRRTYRKGGSKRNNNAIVAGMRGGSSGPSNESSTLHIVSQTLDLAVRLTYNVATFTAQKALPALVGSVRAIRAFYKRLPMDLILAQAGLVYCFCGGYFPALFAALQAAEHCGGPTMIAAISDLTDQALLAIDAVEANQEQHHLFGQAPSPRERLLKHTRLVLKTIDPVRVNQACAAIYASWMGILAVLEKEFARTIALSVTIGNSIRPVTHLVLSPAAYRVIPEDYHQWVPLMVNWTCKAVAVSLVWRIQRVITAYSSAIAGGLLFSRSVFRWARHNRSIRRYLPKAQTTWMDELLGYSVAGLGLYSQVGNGFSFQVPFPLNLVTWPFELVERWIQWQITPDIAEAP